MKKFNIYIANPIRKDPENCDFPFEIDLLRTRGYIPINLDLEKAQEILRKVRMYGANAYIVPVEYMIPKISSQEARGIALKEYNKLLDSGKRLGPLNDGYDDILWWTFRVEDIEAIEADLTPGQISISIDKITSQIRTPKELKEWIKLCDLS